MTAKVTDDMDPPCGRAEPMLEAEGISKTFGRTRVLKDVALRLEAGEIRALLGKNGSGKSTLIKILAGYHAPDEGGRLRIRGRDVPLPLHETEPDKLGLTFVHQGLPLNPSLSVLENVRIGQFETGRLGRIRWSRERQRVRRALASFDADMSPNTMVGELDELHRTFVALSRSLLTLEEHGAGILVLDEPTAFLPPDDVERLFVAVRRMADAGASVIFVSHRIREVLSIAHSISVLRDGRLVETRDAAGVAEHELAEAILGRPLADFYPDATPRREDGREPLLSARGIVGQRAYDVSLDVHPGEILGLTGVRGMGHEEVPYLLYGASQARAGEILIEGRSIPAASLTPPEALKSGVVLVPADRQRMAIVPSYPALDNVSLPVLGRYFRGGRLRRREERREVQHLLNEHAVEPRNVDLPAEFFSGGNQQKMVLLKWLQCAPRVYLLHEPIAGVDVGAKKGIFARIQELAQQGAAVVISSEEWGDLAHVCDRVAVFHHGRMSKQMLIGADITADRIAEHCYRGEQRPGELSAA